MLYLLKVVYKQVANAQRSQCALFSVVKEIGQKQKIQQMNVQATQTMLSVTFTSTMYPAHIWFVIKRLSEKRKKKDEIKPDRRQDAKREEAEGEQSAHQPAAVEAAVFVLMEGNHLWPQRSNDQC